MLDVAGRLQAHCIEHTINLSTTARVRLLIGYDLAGELLSLHMLQESRDSTKLSPSVVTALREDIMQVSMIILAVLL
jgi:hypothetical protein